MTAKLPDVSIAELTTKQSESLQKLEASPLSLTHEGVEAAVIISPKQWAEMQTEIRRLRILQDALQIKKEGKPTVSLAEVKKRIAEKQAGNVAG